MMTWIPSWSYLTCLETCRTLAIRVSHPKEKNASGMNLGLSNDVIVRSEIFPKRVRRQGRAYYKAESQN
jgi:hypothetical protein